MYLKPNEKLNSRWVIEKEIARGGQGVGYKAIDTSRENIPVFIKVAHHPFWGRKSDLVNEVLRAQKLSENHPHIPQIFDLVVSDDDRQMPFYFATWVNGLPFETLLNDYSNGSATAMAMFGYLEQIFETLTYAHQNGVIHGDIKPENILVDTESNQVKIVDWGIAVQTDASKVVGTVTQGTPAYQAPENWLWYITPTPLADQYSLGMIIHRLFSMCCPPSKGYWQSAYAQVMRRSVPTVYDALLKHGSADSFVFKTYRGNLMECLDRVSPNLSDIIMTALQPNPALRFHAQTLKTNPIEASLPGRKLKPLAKETEGIRLFWNVLKPELKKAFHITGADHQEKPQKEKPHIISSVSGIRILLRSINREPRDLNSQPVLPNIIEFLSVPDADFEMGLYPVTVGQYLIFALAEPKHYPLWLESLKNGKVVPRDSLEIRDMGDCLVHLESPIVGVNWNNAVAFCTWLTKQRNDGFEYGLPSEEEWQQAAEGGKGFTYATKSNTPDPELCNSDDSPLFSRLSPVGSFPPNPWGFYDICGNVREWTRSDKGSGSYKADRGGSWKCRKYQLRSDHRNWTKADYAGYDLGFRLIRKPRSNS